MQRDAVEAINLLSVMSFTLLRWLIWTWIALAHLLVLLIAGLLLWWFHVQPEQIREAVHHALGGTVLSAAMWIGLSPLGLVAFYWGLSKLAHRLVYRSQWIATHMSGSEAKS